MKKILLLAVTVFCFTNIINAQAGQLDPSFGNHGIDTTDFGFMLDTVYPASSSQVLLLPGGGTYILIHKEQDSVSYLSKRLPNGSPDLSYGQNSFSSPADIYATNAAVQKDGKIVVAGYKLAGTNHYDGVVAMVRYNTDGSLDESFENKGPQIVDSSFLNEANAVAIQSDGKIVLAGVIHYGFAVFRFNSDGSPDSSFSNDGIKQLFGFGTLASAVAIQKDGKIVVAGGGYIGGMGWDFLIARFNVDGSLDSSFSGDGIATTDFGDDDQANSISIQNDGKIVAAGYADNMVALARYNTDGSLDIKEQTSYDPNNERYHRDFANSVAIQSDGKIVAGGSLLIRYNKDGSLDSTFGKDGIADFGEYFVSVVIAGGGKILVAGGNFYLLRYNSDGSADTTFGSDGFAGGKLQFKQGSTFYTGTAIQSDEKVVAVGYTWTGKHYDLAIARYNTDGSLDNTFDNDGRQTSNLGSNFYRNTIAIQGDGKIVVAGMRKYPHVELARYNTNGSFDKTFGLNGKADLTFNPGVIVASITIQNDGKIVLGGDSYVIRLNNNGSLDSSFSDNGIQDFSFGGLGGGVTAVSIQNDGKIIAAGGAYASPGKYSFAVARYNPDGSVDKSFNGNGRVTTKVGLASYASSLAVQTDGKIVVGGTGGNGSGSGDDFAVVRYDANGSLDSTFGNGGKQTMDFIAYSDRVTSIAIEKDGKILLGGTAGLNYYQGGTLYQQGLFGVARCNSDGSIDSTFNKTGKQITVVPGHTGITGIVIGGNKLYAVGSGKFPNELGVVVRYLLDDEKNTPSTVTLTAPTNNATYLAPAAHIKLSAAASDSDGAITKVEFYNGTTLLHTETLIPYGFVWENVKSGNYTLTAKAYDNSGNATTSAAVHISVVPNKPPVVSIIKPANNQNFTAPANIRFEAAASDSDGRITRVEFYKDSTLLRTENKYPYSYNWKNVTAGTYKITAIATDNYGAQTTSASITVTVTSDSAIVSNRAYSGNKKTPPNDALSLRLSPNPASSIVNIYTYGLQQNKPATLSIISVAGIVLKTMRISNAATHLDVSSLAGGVYTVKIISGDKVLYKEFVKL